MSFLLRPSVLTNHIGMLGLFLIGTFLLAPAAAVLFSVKDPDHVFQRLAFAGLWPQALWVIAVSIKAQNWENKLWPRLIWIGLALAIPTSIALAPHLGALAFWIFITYLALAIQIACLLEKDWGARALHSILVMMWPFFLSFFAQRLRKILISAQQETEAKLS